MDLKALWRRNQERIDALTLRERVLLFSALVALTYTAVFMGFIRPLEHKAQAAARALAVAHRQTQVFEYAFEHVLDPKTRLREAAQRAALLTQVAHLKERLHLLTNGLVPAHDMPALMHHVLVEVPGVTLLALVNHAAVPISRTPKSRPFLYRHEMTIVVRGPYRDLTHYLTVLAHTKRRILWGRVMLTADRYPFSTVSLHIYTLSAREALLQ